MGCGMNREGAIEQTWQSNRAVRMENVGQTDVVDPWLSNGRNNFRNIKEIVASAVSPGMSDGEKAIALWYQQIQHRYHSSAGGEELGDPVKVFNIYGLNPCGKDAMMMGGLWKQVGLKGGPGPAGGPRHRPGPLRRRLARDGRRPGHDLPAAGQRDRRRATGSWPATMTW